MSPPKNALFLFLLGFLHLSLRHVFEIELVRYFHESFRRGALSPLSLLFEVLTTGLPFLGWVVLLQVFWHFLFAARLEDLLSNLLQIFEFGYVARAARKLRRPACWARRIRFNFVAEGIVGTGLPRDLSARE